MCDGVCVCVWVSEREKRVWSRSVGLDYLSKKVSDSSANLDELLPALKIKPSLKSAFK